jgi:hypothetical protein
MLLLLCVPLGSRHLLLPPFIFGKMFRFGLVTKLGQQELGLSGIRPGGRQRKAVLAFFAPPAISL